MPYFITDKSVDCEGWATIKEDGEVLGCHDSKQDAIDQMIALSLAEDMEPGGERDLPDNYRPALQSDVPDGRACGNCRFYDESNVRGDKAFCEKWDEYVDGAYYCNAWQPDTGYRNLDGPPAIIVDIDGTLLTYEGDTIANVVAFVSEYDGEVIIITARVEADRAATIVELDAADVDYDQLFMKSTADADSVKFKSDTLKDILDVYNVELAIENDEDIRAEYARIGITVLTPAAVDPAELPQMLQRIVQQTMQQLVRAPAPPEDQITGSDQNQPGSAQGAGGDIDLSEATVTGLRNKVRDHNDMVEADGLASYHRTTLGQLSAVYRRGAGAFSTSHRPGVSRNQWAMARVNAFLYLLKNDRPENPAYVSDYDLLPSGHPKSTRALRVVDTSPPAYIQAAAQRGLDLRADGYGGDGLVERTIREARLMASGEISEDKVIRTSAWAARHLVDLDAEQNSNADADGWPGNGAVAFYLWGIDPLDPEPAIAWFDGVAQKIRDEEARSWGSVQVRDRPAATLFTMTNGVEQRRITINEFEVRDAGADGMTFVGLAAAFNSPSQPLPFIERIAPGAFTRSLRSRNEIKLFVNHDTSRVLASKRAGTLRLSESTRGLEVEADLPDTTDGRDMAVLLKRGDIDSMSFGFSVPQGGDAWSDNGQERELREVRLHEVSIVTGFPAYEATVANVRSLDGLVDATGLEHEKLAEAITALEKGETLSDDLASILDAAVTKLRSERDDVAQALDLKQKQLDMLLARV